MAGTRDTTLGRAVPHGAPARKRLRNNRLSPVWPVARNRASASPVDREIPETDTAGCLPRARTGVRAEGVATAVTATAGRKRGHGHRRAPAIPAFTTAHART